MKKWFNSYVKHIGDFKFLMAMYFMGTVLVYMIVAYLMGVQNVAVTTLWQIVLTSVLGAGLQTLFFESQILNKVAHKTRIAIHFLVIYFMLMLLSQLFNWFTLEDFKLAMVLTGGYIFFYVAIFWAFYIYYKTEGNKYKEKLNAFKSKVK